MPYIKKAQRLDVVFDGFSKLSIAGELNYMLTMTITEYLKQKGESYQTYNDIIGALEGCKMELYRRKISIYENKKIKENGDVY